MFLPLLAGLAEERQQVLEQQFRAFFRDPVTAGEHGARDVAGVQVHLVGDGLAQSALAADRQHPAWPAAFRGGGSRRSGAPR